MAIEHLFYIKKFVLFLVSVDLFSLPFPIIAIQAEGQNIEVVAEGLLLKKLKMWYL